MNQVEEQRYLYLRQINPEITEFRFRGKNNRRISSYEKAEITSRHTFSSEESLLDTFRGLNEFQGIQYLNVKQIPFFLNNTTTIHPRYLEKKKLENTYFKNNLSNETKTPGSYLEFIFTEDTSEKAFKQKLKESLIFRRNLDSSLLLTQVKFSTKNIIMVTSSKEIQNSEYKYINAVYGNYK